MIFLSNLSSKTRHIFEIWNSTALIACDKSSFATMGHSRRKCTKMKPKRSSFYILRGCGPLTLYELVYPKCMYALTNSEDPDEMPHNGFSEKEIHFIWKSYHVIPQCIQWTFSSVLFEI